MPPLRGLPRALVAAGSPSPRGACLIVPDALTLWRLAVCPPCPPPPFFPVSGPGFVRLWAAAVLAPVAVAVLWASLTPASDLYDLRTAALIAELSGGNAVAATAYRTIFTLQKM